jgi:hypothetical protein
MDIGDGWSVLEMIGRIDMNNNPAPEELSKLLERYAICYEVSPESAILRGHAIRQVGYVVSLYGDDERDRPLLPGDDCCHEILRGLYRISRWAAPGDHGTCHIDISGVGASLHYLKGANGRWRVQVEIRILHAGAPDRPIDADQKRALEELVGRLEALGVRSASNAPEAGRSSAGCA